MAPSTRTKRDGIPGTRIILLFFSEFQVQESPDFLVSFRVPSIQPPHRLLVFGSLVCLSVGTPALADPDLSTL